MNKKAAWWIATAAVFAKNNVAAEYAFHSCSTHATTAKNATNYGPRRNFDFVLQGEYCWVDNYETFDSKYYSITFRDANPPGGLPPASTEVTLYVTPVLNRGGCLLNAGNEPRTEYYDDSDVGSNCVSRDIRLNKDGSKLVDTWFGGLEDYYCLSESTMVTLIDQALAYEGNACEGKTLSASSNEPKNVTRLEPFGSFLVLAPSTGDIPCDTPNCYFDELIAKSYSTFVLYWTGVTRRGKDFHPYHRALEEGRFSVVARPANEIPPAGQPLVADYGSVKLFNDRTGSSIIAFSAEEVEQAIQEWPFATLSELAAALGSLGQGQILEPRLQDGQVPFCTVFSDGTCRNSTELTDKGDNPSNADTITAAPSQTSSSDGTPSLAFMLAARAGGSFSCLMAIAWFFF